MGYLNLWVLLGALVVTLGIAIFGGGGFLWLAPAVVAVVIVVLAATLRRAGGGEDLSNRTMNTSGRPHHR